MGAYAIRRLLWVPVTVFLVSVFVFLLVRFIPGNIVDLLEAQLSQNISGGVTINRADVVHMLGLDVPMYLQYGHWMGNIILHGNLGMSLRGSMNISEEIAHRLPVTLELGILGILIGVVISIPIGVYSAIRQDTITDYIARSFAILLISVPSFWIGTIVMIYPSIWWNWSPPMEYIPFMTNPLGNLGMMIIPAVILGTGLTGATMRMTRGMMLEVLRQDYTRTAWAKGLGERVIVVRHAMKNALIPVVTLIGMQLPLLISGSVIIEQIFVLPGIGQLAFNALNMRDYNIISGVNLVISIFIVFINLFVDLSYGWLDPRIHYQ
jgi:peptide/nickel transport system permease protein